MSQFRCKSCNRLYSSHCGAIGELCGVRLSSDTWCQGKLVEHECGGHSEACNLRNCEECGDTRLSRVEAAARALIEARRLLHISASIEASGGCVGVPRRMAEIEQESRAAAALERLVSR